MLRFFRHIRRNLFLEGKVSRYFGYAVGEIVLIVVGILIALQISDWSDEQKELEKSHEILHEILFFPTKPIFKAHLLLYSSTSLQQGIFDGVDERKGGA